MPMITLHPASGDSFPHFPGPDEMFGEKMDRGADRRIRWIVAAMVGIALAAAEADAKKREDDLQKQLDEARGAAAKMEADSRKCTDGEKP